MRKIIVLFLLVATFTYETFGVAMADSESLCSYHSGPQFVLQRERKNLTKHQYLMRVEYPNGKAAFVKIRTDNFIYTKDDLSQLLAKNDQFKDGKYTLVVQRNFVSESEEDYEKRFKDKALTSCETWEKNKGKKIPFINCSFTSPFDIFHNNFDFLDKHYRSDFDEISKGLMKFPSSILTELNNNCGYQDGSKLDFSMCDKGCEKTFNKEMHKSICLDLCGLMRENFVRNQLAFEQGQEHERAAKPAIGPEAPKDCTDSVRGGARGNKPTDFQFPSSHDPDNSTLAR